MRRRTGRERSQNRAGSLFLKAASLTDFERSKYRIGYLNFPHFVLKKAKHIISKSAQTLWQFLYNESLFHVNHSITTTRKQISEQICCTVRTVCTLLKELEFKGFIFRKRKNRSLQIQVSAPEKITDHIIYILIKSKKEQEEVTKNHSPCLYYLNNINNNTQAVRRVRRITSNSLPKTIVYDLRKKKDEEKAKRDSDEKLKEECSKRIQNLDQQIADLHKITRIESVRRADETLMGYMLRINALKTHKQRDAEQRMTVLDRTRTELTHEILRIENRWKEKPAPEPVQNFITQPGCRTFTASDRFRLKRCLVSGIIPVHNLNEMAYAVRFGSFQNLPVPHAISCCLKLYQEKRWEKPRSLCLRH